jgi:hypothetical protein
MAAPAQRISTTEALSDMLGARSPELRRLLVKTLNLHAPGVVEDPDPKTRKERVRQAIEESLKAAPTVAEAASCCSKS